MPEWNGTQRQQFFTLVAEGKLDEGLHLIEKFIDLKLNDFNPKPAADLKRFDELYQTNEWLSAGILKFLISPSLSAKRAGLVLARSLKDLDLQPFMRLMDFIHTRLPEPLAEQQAWLSAMEPEHPRESALCREIMAHWEKDCHLAARVPDKVPKYAPDTFQYIFMAASAHPTYELMAFSVSTPWWDDLMRALRTKMKVEGAFRFLEGWMQSLPDLDKEECNHLVYYLMTRMSLPEESRFNLEYHKAAELVVKLDLAELKQVILRRYPGAHFPVIASGDNKAAALPNNIPKGALQRKLLKLVEKCMEYRKTSTWDGMILYDSEKLNISSDLHEIAEKMYQQLSKYPSNEYKIKSSHLDCKWVRLYLAAHLMAMREGGLEGVERAWPQVEREWEEEFVKKAGAAFAGEDVHWDLSGMLALYGLCHAAPEAGMIERMLKLFRWPPDARPVCSPRTFISYLLESPVYRPWWYGLFMSVIENHLAYPGAASNPECLEKHLKSNPAANLGRFVICMHAEGQHQMVADLFKKVEAIHLEQGELPMRKRLDAIRNGCFTSYDSNNQLFNVVYLLATGAAGYSHVIHQYGYQYQYHDELLEEIRVSQPEVYRQFMESFDAKEVSFGIIWCLPAALMDYPKWEKQSSDALDKYLVFDHPNNVSEYAIHLVNRLIANPQRGRLARFDLLERLKPGLWLRHLKDTKLVLELITLLAMDHIIDPARAFPVIEELLQVESFGHIKEAAAALVKLRKIHKHLVLNDRSRTDQLLATDPERYEKLLRPLVV